MSFDMFIFDEPYYQHLNPNMISQEFSSNFFTDPLSDSSIDTLLQEISSDEPIQNPNNNNNNNNNNDSISTPLNHSQISPNEAQSLDQIAQTLLSNSPPSHLLETLSLSQPQQTQTHFTDLSNSCDLSSGLCDYSVSDVVKTEDFHLGFDSSTYNHSYFINGGGYNNTFANEECFAKYMQRSYSSNSFDGKPSYPFQPRFDTLLNTQSIVGIGSSEVDSGYPSSQIRRVCSTGDLPVNSPEVGMNQMTQQMVCTTTSGGYVGEGNVIEDSNFKVGRYSAEERKERIDRYRAKRTQRNFNKTIKYACRKTLADNRPRIRGRFARNDEPGEIPKPNTGDDDDLWVDNLQEEEEEGIIVGGGRGGRLVSNFGGIHFQYYGY